MKSLQDTAIEAIAKKHLRIDTLEARHSDSLDFHDCGVLSIKAALEEAFKMGLEVGIAAGVDTMARKF